MSRVILTVAITMLVQLGFIAEAVAQRKSKEVVQKIEARFEPAVAKPGDKVTWKLTVRLADHWHTFTTKQLEPGSSNITLIDQRPVAGLSPVGEIVDPPGGSLDNPEGGPPLRILENEFTWERTFEVTAQAANGPLKLMTVAKIQVCDDRHCLPADKFETPATLTIQGGAAAPAAPITLSPAPIAPPDTVNGDALADASSYRKTMESILANMEKREVGPRSGLASFLLTAMFWGAATLFTPCVFPMIPITVSFFLKQSEKNHASPLLLAIVYCGTIVAVLGTASLTLLSFFTALSINPWMNLFLATLFVVLGLSLFGMFDLTLPSFLTRFTSSREGQGGIIGAVFMALTFTIVSFTCVAPFLGGFGGMAADGQYQTWELVLGSLAFAATFASPFFLLALFPSLIRKLPKSGGWLHTVKVVMAFIEIAAALKFFRTAELIFFREPVLFTYDLVLGAWVVLSLLCGMYLMRLIHIGNAEDNDGQGVGIPRFMLGVSFMVLGIYLLPALFAGGPEGGNHRPRGSVFAWVDSFLLPDPTDVAASGELNWTGDLKRALDNARLERQRSGKPAYVFVDFTGATCTNCKLNERDVFVRPEVKEQLGKYQLVQLYTDKVPDKLYSSAVRATFKNTDRQTADADVNRWFGDQAFGTLQLPTYAILAPIANGKTQAIAIYDEGKINNVGKFMEFLKKPFEG